VPRFLKIKSVKRDVVYHRLNSGFFFFSVFPNRFPFALPRQWGNSISDSCLENSLFACVSRPLVIELDRPFCDNVAGPDSRARRRVPTLRFRVEQPPSFPSFLLGSTRPGLIDSFSDLRYGPDRRFCIFVDPNLSDSCRFWLHFLAFFLICVGNV